MKTAKLEQRRTIYEGRVFTVECDRVQMPSGHTIDMDVIRHPGSVVLLPMPSADEIILIRQYRYTIDRWIWELPEKFALPWSSAPRFQTPISMAEAPQITSLLTNRDLDRLARLRLNVSRRFTNRARGEHLAAKGLAVERVNKVAQGRPHIVDKLTDGDVQLVFNTTEGWQSLKDSHSIRRTALERKVPYFTTAAASLAVAHSIGALRGRELEVRSLQAYYSALEN